MTAKKQEYVCIEKEQLSNQSRKIAELEARADYKDKRIDELNIKLEKMDEKIDKLAENVNQLVVQSTKDDKELELRLKAIEIELTVQKEAAINNHNRLSSILALVGVGLTIVTILINVFFNIIH